MSTTEDTPDTGWRGAGGLHSVTLGYLVSLGTLAWSSHLHTEEGTLSFLLA